MPAQIQLSHAVHASSDPAPTAQAPEDISRYVQVREIFETQLQERLRGPFPPILRKALLATMRSFVNYRGYLRMAHDWAGLSSGEQYFQWMQAWLRPQVQVTGLENVPRNGRCLLVANHPTGFADGVALFAAGRSIRSDVGVFVISHLTEFNSHLTDRIVPVERREFRKTRASSRVSLSCARKGFQAERLMALFPAGRESRLTLRGVRDLPWKSTAIKLARRYRAPLLPVHIQARHSPFFYLCRALSMTLGELQSLNELQNSYRRPYTITIGKPMGPQPLAGDADKLTADLQHFVERQLPSCPKAVFKPT